MSGTLTGIGLGPGDPELITLKAARLIGRAHCIAWPALPGQDSFARRIAAGLLPPGVEEIRLDIPMTTERGPAQAAYDEGARRIAARLDGGTDILFLCEGDPLFYGSFMYLLTRLQPRHEVQVVPGVTSLTACAAAALLPLAERSDRLAVIPATLDDAALRRAVTRAESVAILKAGRHLGRVRAVLDDLGLGERAVYVERASLPEQRVLPLAAAPDPAPYFSTILVTREPAL